jgi:hypothetical protein
MTLRKDQSQWLIYDRESVLSIAGGAQCLLALLGAQALSGHPDIRIRAIAEATKRICLTQLRHWSGQIEGLDPSPEQTEVATYVSNIVSWLGGEGEPPEELDEFHAALVWLDGRAKAAGVAGPGWYREAVRESGLRREV